MQLPYVLDRKGDKWVVRGRWRAPGARTSMSRPEPVRRVAIRAIRPDGPNPGTPSAGELPAGHPPVGNKP